MGWFLAVFLSIYGAMHLYLLLKVCAAFPGLARLRIVVAAVLLALMAGPIAVQWLTRARHFQAAKALALVGYPWMAVLFWFCLAMLLLDGWNLALRAVALAAPSTRMPLIPPRAAFLVVAGLVAILAAWGLHEAQNIRVRRLTFDVPRLPAVRREVTLVLISDLHLGVSVGRRRLEKAARLASDARPDILLSLGDLVDAEFEQIRPLALPLRDIDAPLGKFAVFGNHEYYWGLDNSQTFHQAAGFRVLHGEAVNLADALRLAGVDDPAGEHRAEPCRTDEDPLLPPDLAPDRLTTNLLKHQPRVQQSSHGRFHLQLSGHTHGGQIFPFHLVTALSFRYPWGLHALPRGAVLYASLGAGTWGPPMRLLAPPEVAVITLRGPEERITR